MSYGAYAGAPAYPPGSGNGSYDPWRQQQQPSRASPRSTAAPSRSPAPGRPYDPQTYHGQSDSYYDASSSPYPPAGSGRSGRQYEPIARSASPAPRSGGLPPGLGAHTPGDEKSKSEASLPLPSLSDEYAAAGEKGLMPSTTKRQSIQMVKEGKISKGAGLRMWRSEEHHGAFTRGGRRRTCLRCVGCTVAIALLLIIGIVVAFLLWVRAPNVIFNGVDPPSDGQQVSGVANGFLLNFLLDINVLNPNFFGATFPSVVANAFYPVSGNPAIGGGELDNIEIHPHSNTSIKFPFTITYTTAIDPNKAILTDLATKCGFIGGVKSNVKVNYSLTLRLKSDISTLLGSNALGGSTTSSGSTGSSADGHDKRAAMQRINRALTDSVLKAM